MITLARDSMPHDFRVACQWGLVRETPPTTVVVGMIGVFLYHISTLLLPLKLLLPGIESVSRLPWPPMADYDIFREQLSLRYSTYGHALWEPGPSEPNNPVKVGDVGYTRNGSFHRLFNALLSAEDQSDVPKDHKPLTLKRSSHIVKRSLSSDHYCSAGISKEREPDTHDFG